MVNYLQYYCNYLQSFFIILITVTNSKYLSINVITYSDFFEIFDGKMPSKQLLEKIKNIADQTKSTGGKNVPIFNRAEKHQFVKRRHPTVIRSILRKPKKKSDLRICYFILYILSSGNLYYFPASWTPYPPLASGSQSPSQPSTSGTARTDPQGNEKEGLIYYNTNYRCFFSQFFLKFLTFYYCRQTQPICGQ